MPTPVSGIFAQVSLTAGTPAQLYIAPTGITATVEVDLCN